MWVFRCFLKDVTDGLVLTWTGSEFQKAGAWWLKDLVRYLWDLCILESKEGTWRNLYFGLLRLVFLDEVYGWSLSLRYTGWPYLRTLYVINPILKRTLYLTGSQCSFSRFGVVWVYLEDLVTTRQREFWTPCNLFSSERVSEAKRELQ